MNRQFTSRETTDERILMTSVTDYHCHSFFFSAERPAWCIGRWVGFGALTMTLGALTLGVVYASRTQPARAIGIGASSHAPVLAPLTSPRRGNAAPQAMKQTPAAGPTIGVPAPRRSLHPIVGDDRRQRATNLYFTPGGLTFILTGSTSTSGLIRKTSQSGESTAEYTPTVSPHRFVALYFVGANPEVNPQWEPMPAAITPLTESTVHQKTGESASVTLLYRDLWPGIDLFYTITGNELRSTFLVKPGADPNRIRFAYHGVTAVARTDAGQLAATTPLGNFSEETPVAYQESDYLAHLARLKNGFSEKETPMAYQERVGRRVETPVAYTLETAEDTAVHGIHVGEYDPNTTLIINRVVRYPGYGGEGHGDLIAGLAGLSLGTLPVSRLVGQSYPSADLPARSR